MTQSSTPSGMVLSVGLRARSLARSTAAWCCWTRSACCCALMGTAGKWLACWCVIMGPVLTRRAVLLVEGMVCARVRGVRGR